MNRVPYPDPYPGSKRDESPTPNDSVFVCSCLRVIIFMFPVILGGEPESGFVQGRLPRVGWDAGL